MADRIANDETAAGAADGAGGGSPAPARRAERGLLETTVSAGGQVLVVSDLHLERHPTPGRSAATAALAGALKAARGPGVLVMAGNTFAGGTPSGPGSPASVLADHSRLVDAITAWATGGADRLVVVLPGERDAHLGWSPDAAAEVEQALGATVAPAVDLVLETGSGHQRVRVEPGRDLDELSRVADPSNPAETPLGHHLRRELIPAVIGSSHDRPGPYNDHNHDRPDAPPGPGGARQGPQRSLLARLARRGLGRDWLEGADALDDQAAFPSFVASRLVYRLLGSRAWLLLVPIVVAIVLRVPVRLATVARTHFVGPGHARFVLLAFAIVVEVALLVAVVIGALQRTWRALAGVSIGIGPREPNRAARDRARSLIAGGYDGLVTGHTCRAELTDLVCGFYANPGCLADVVTEAPPRLPGLGLPPAFVPLRQVSWLELEGGGTLHVRLVLARRALPGATVAERVCTRRPRDSGGQDLRPEQVGSFPLGESWPAEPSGQLRRRRVRRWSSLFVAVAALVSLVSAFSEPLRDRLGLIREIVPLVVPETAAALTAIAGVSLLMLARGVRRGQRRAWAATLAILVLSAVTNVVKGVDVEEATVALAVAAFLWVNRADFAAAADRPRLRRDVLGWLGTAALTVVAGTAGIELGARIRTIVAHHLRHLDRTRHLHLRVPPRFSIGWGQALRATLERMVGLGNVPLPGVIDRFVDPTMATAAAGLALLLAAIVFRPVVARRRHPGNEDGPAASLERARDIVSRHGRGTLDYFALRSDKELFFWGDTVIAYGVYGGVCLVSPDPVGPLPEREPAWRAFRHFADAQSWILGCLGAGAEWLPIYQATGMRTIYIGDEGVVRTERFSLGGGRFKGLRQAVNRVAKYGYTISFHDPSELDADLQAKLREVMTRSRRGDVERGFSMTLGRVFDPADTGLLLAVVHAPSGEPVAFCQYVPAPGIGGYSLDLMRRDDGEHPNGLIDFAVVETIRHLAAEGRSGLGLNFATMRAVIAGEAGEGLTQRAQAWLLRRMGDSMQIESLWRFNAKFDPEWLPRYLVYDAPENTVAVAMAVARAESFWELPVIGRWLVPEEQAAPRAPATAGAASGSTG